MHDVKLLELVAIAKNNHKSYLQIKLISEHEFEFFWEVDDATAIYLAQIYEADGNYRYRVSLNAIYNNISEQYISSLTKTYREFSEPIFFICSAEYKLCLEAIKNSQNNDELTSLPFIFTSLPALNTSVIPTTHEPDMMFKKRRTAKLSWLAAIICTLLVIVAASSHHIDHSATLDSTVVIAAQPIMTMEPVNAVIAKNDNTPVTQTSYEYEDSTLSNLYYVSANDSITYSIPKGSVALTFDDGPSKYTTSIADILKEHNVGGTFFFLGVNAKKHPESVRYVLENKFSVGNHSMSHKDMTQLTIEEQEQELLQAAKVIEDITKEKMVLFRPPYGALNDQAIKLVQSNQFKIVQWNRDPEDWKTRDADKIIEYVLNNDASGSIILLHESQTVIDALPTLIRVLQEQNLNIVSLQ